MTRNKSMDLSGFFIAGINYKKTDSSVRGQFAISPDQYNQLLAEAQDHAVNEVFVLSTCNRTEIYGFAPDADHLIDLLCRHTTGSPAVFREMAYIKSGLGAIKHLFSVAAGLDSQILGDYEIVGQIKQAVKISKERGFVGGFTERLVNHVLQSSKCIKNNTALSDGTVSVSFAAVQYIKENVSNPSEKKILMLGTGKIGKNTCRNLKDYLGSKQVTLINRTDEKATELARELELRFAPLSELEQEIANADIVLVATNSQDPIVLSSHLENRGDKLIIDLSIPFNVESSASGLSNITLVQVDELSRLADATLLKRQEEVPKARAIIAEHMQEFLEWHEMRKYVPVLKEVKIKLQEIHSNPQFIHIPSSTAIVGCKLDERIQKVINGMASKMRIQNQRGCQYIQAINEFIATGTN